MPNATHLETARLTLRPPREADAAEIAALANDREIAATTLKIPYPYDEPAARSWIESSAHGALEGTSRHFVLRQRESRSFVGSVGLKIDPEHEHAELGYWIGKPFWGQGLASEAGSAVVRFGFENLGLHRIFAQAMSQNPASARVLEKIGLRREGRRRQHLKKWGEWVDLELYGLLASDPRPEA